MRPTPIFYSNKANDRSHHIKYVNRFPPTGMLLMWNSFRPPLHKIFDFTGLHRMLVLSEELNKSHIETD